MGRRRRRWRGPWSWLPRAGDRAAGLAIALTRLYTACLGSRVDVRGARRQRGFCLKLVVGSSSDCCALARLVSSQSRAELDCSWGDASLRCAARLERVERASIGASLAAGAETRWGLQTQGELISLSLSLSLSLFSYSGLRRESVPLQLSGQRICPLVSGTDSCSAARETSPRRPDTARSVPRLGKISPKSRLVHTRSQRASDVSGIDRMGQPSALLWAALAPLVLILIVVSLPRYPSQVLHTQS